MSRTRTAALGAAHSRARASDGERWRELRRSARPAARLREGRNDWFRMSNLAGDGDAPAVIDIYDEIGFYGVTAADFIADLRTITASAIELHINSPGGDVYDGIAIYSALVDHDAYVTVKVDALAASAASFIAQAGDHVVMGRNSELMVHDAWGLCVGNAADMVEMAAMLDKASDNIASIYSARAGGGVAAWRKRMSAESWYSAQEAVDVGLADEVATTEKRRGTAEPAAKWDLSVFSYGSRAEAPAPEAAVVEVEPEVEDPPAPPPPPPPAPPDDETVPPAAVEADQIEWPDDIPWDPKSLHVAMCDAADSADIGVDTTAMRESFEFPYDADGLRGLLVDLADHAPAPPPLPPTKPASRYVDIDLFTDSLKGALTP